MNILITGATGLIGQSLVKECLERGHQVTIVSREKTKAQKTFPPAVKVIVCDLVQNKIEEDLSSVQAVIHLMGESVASGRWTEKRKEEIYKSRVLSAKNLIQSFAQAPKLFITGSAIGIYGDRGEEALDESASFGDDFLARVCKDWEAEFQAVQELPEGRQSRIVQVRTSLVLSPHGGALEKMRPLFRKGLGGALGKGQQWMSWIHIQDLVRAFCFIIDEAEISGPVNAATNQPLRNVDFSRTLARTYGRKLGLSVPEFALRFLLGEMSEMLLTSQKVIPKKLQSQKFEFHFPSLAEALADVCKEN